MSNAAEHSLAKPICGESKAATLIATFHPLRHKLLVRATLGDDAHPLAGGFILPPPKDLPPLAIPAYQRQRLIGFLEARYPVLPRFLDYLLPRIEAADARRLYRQFRREGMEPGDALALLGIIAQKPLHPIPLYAYATILRSGCECASALSGAPRSPTDLYRSIDLESDLWDVLILSSSGEFLEEDLRVIRCYDCIARIPPIRERIADLQRSRSRERFSFADLRVKAG